MPMAQIDQTSFSLGQNKQYQINNKLNAIKNSGEPQNIEAIKESAQEFEAVFLSQMVKTMFEGINVDPLFGGGKGEDMFQSLLIQEYGKEMASAGGIGIADHVARQLVEIQSGAR